VKLSGFLFECDKIVIGGTLEALIYAYIEDLPIIFCERKEPSYFNFFDSELSLDKFGFTNQSTELTIPNGTSIVGSLKRDLYEHLMFFLSLSGNIPLSDKARSIRIEKEGILRVSTKNSRLARFKYKKLVVFDDKSVYNIPNKTISQSRKKLKILDWFNISSGMRQKLDHIKMDDPFVNEIYLYPSDRIDGNHLELKDCVCISYIDEEDLQSFEYSDTYVKFKLLKIFKSLGMRGARNGRSKEDPTKFKYYALKLDSTERQYFSTDYNIYENSDSVKFVYDKAEDIIAGGELLAGNKPRSFQQRLMDES